MLGFPLIRRSSGSSQDGMEPAVPGQCEAAGLPSRFGIDARPERQGQGPVVLLQQAPRGRQGGLPPVLHGQLIAVVDHQGLLPGKRLEVLKPQVGLHLVLPRVSVAAHLLPGRDDIVATAASIQGL